MIDKYKLLGTFIGFILIVLCYAVDLLITCGIVKFITLCFSLKFSWLISIGIWLVIRLIRICIK